MSKRDHDKATKAAFDYQTAQLAITNIEAQRTRRIAEIDAEYGADLEKAKAIVADTQELLEAYAKKNREDLFTGTAKTVVFGPIKMSFKCSPPKIDLAEGMTMEDVMAKVGKYLPAYVRTKLELDKRKLMSDKDELAKEMKKCGLEIIQEEKFELKL